MQQEILLITYYQIQILQKIQLILSAERVAESRYRYTQYTQRTPSDNSKDVTDQGHLTENLVNKLQNRYGIALEQNLDYAVLQLKFALAVGAVYFTIALRLIVKTSPAYVSLILRVMTVRICNNLECIRLSSEAASQRKTQNASKLICIIIQTNVPKRILKWECRLLLMLQKFLENASMETSYFTKMFN